MMVAEMSVVINSKGGGRLDTVYDGQSIYTERVYIQVECIYMGRDRCGV